jgi:hypothetical protein
MRQAPKKKQRSIFDPACWWQLDPFGKLVRLVRCQELGQGGGKYFIMILLRGAGVDIDVVSQSPSYYCVSESKYFNVTFKFLLQIFHVTLTKKLAVTKIGGQNTVTTVITK